MGSLVDVCVIERIAPYQTYIWGVCGEKLGSRASQRNGDGQVNVAACGPDKVGYFRIRSLRGVGVGVRCGGS